MPSYRSLRSAKPPKLNLKTAETEQTSNNSARNVSIMDATERRILYELARSEQRKPIRDLAKACKISTKTTRKAIKKLTGDGIITANHTIRNPEPWQFQYGLNGHNLPARIFVAAVEIIKHPTLSNAEIAERTGTSRKTVTRAGQHVQRITQLRRSKRIQLENANAETSESSRRATAQHNAAEERRKKAEAAKEEKAKRSISIYDHLARIREACAKGKHSEEELRSELKKIFGHSKIPFTEFNQQRRARKSNSFTEFANEEMAKRRARRAFERQQRRRNRFKG